ncbi:MAG: FmdE family protein [Anaerolineae bacterium]|nr:FmdE family protein [Anaerolineae bacterium]MDW8068408.1 FmdE family protein [Anaerolineae bacterium]
MLTREAVFRQIDADRVIPIQEVVGVLYDNYLRMPVRFRHRGREYDVVELIGAFRESSSPPSTLYLVRVQEGTVFALYLDLTELVEQGGQMFWRGQWVLHFQVEEEEAMLVDLRLKQIADFHGHLCPDLALGYRVSQYALERLTMALMSGVLLRVIVENTTSAVDAIQHMTGCTVGNRRLLVRDWGKHVYTFIYSDSEGLRLSLRPGILPANPEMAELEGKIQAGQATLMETARYQTLLDQRIMFILETPAETLFAACYRPVGWPMDQHAMAFARCEVCDEPVLETHLILQNGRHCCLGCVSGRLPVCAEE